MTNGAGWNCTVLNPSGDIELEQLDHAGSEWLGIGPGGEATGELLDVLATAAADGTDPAWTRAVADALQRELAVGERRPNLLVKRGAGVWYHATFAANRDSIQRRGLDWQFMNGHGIAGSTAPEWPGIFLSASIEDARFFVRIGARRGPIDIWEVQLEGQWLEGAPDSDGGGGDNWMICTAPIPRKRIRLLERDLTQA
jgi:hypothetical protein